MKRKYNPDIHKRQSIRLKGYDYSKKGIYFVTISTHNNERLFGEIADNEMQLNYAGRMIEKSWEEILEFYNGFKLHDYVVMPNHFHGIIEIVDRGEDKINPQAPKSRASSSKNRAPTRGARTLGEIIGAFKSRTTNEYIKLVKQNILPSFDMRIWHRNYYENIIRDEEMYEKVVKYVRNNPANWKEDRFYEMMK